MQPENARGRTQSNTSLKSFATVIKVNEISLLEFLTAFDSYETAHGVSSVMKGGRVVRTVTSGDWGRRISLKLAYAFLIPILRSGHQSFGGYVR